MIERLRDFARVLDHVARIAIDERVDLVVDAGDTFDSPHPDPWSVNQFQKFITRLHEAGIKYIGISGNHNLHPISAKLDASWLDVVQYHNEFRDLINKTPEDKHIITLDPAGNLNDSITIAACNWMPSSQIAGWLAENNMPPVSLLVLHQSCEGFLPEIASTEISLDQLKGRAEYVAIGDIHVHASQVIDGVGQGKTTVASAGSTEMNSTNEPKEKFVYIVDFEAGRLKQIRSVPLPTRKCLFYPLVNAEVELSGIRSEVLSHSPENGGPLVCFKYNVDLSHQVMRLKQDLNDLGFILIRVESSTVIDFSESHQASMQGQSSDMIDVLAEVTIDTPELTPIARDLWLNPDNHEAILNGLLEQIQKQENSVCDLNPSS